MDLAYYSNSKAFSESFTAYDPKLTQFYSIKGRLQCFFSLCKKLFILPFALVTKTVKTTFRILGFFLAVVALFFTIGKSTSIRRFLEKRTHRLASDLVDWILYPLAVLTCVIRHLLAATVHPKIEHTF